MSSSLLVIGELGEVFRLESSNDLKKCVDLYIKRMGLEHNDIYLLDKNGRTIYLNTINDLSSDLKFFIFNKTFYKDRLVKIFEENVDKIHNTFTNNNINLLPFDYSNSNLEFSDFNDILNLLSNGNNINCENQSDAFTNLAYIIEKKFGNINDVKKLSDFFIGYFDDLKNNFKSLKINFKICEKIRDNYNYQYNSLECVYKNISVLYEQCYNKFKELEYELSKMNEKNENIILLFKESIEKLKSIELHPKMSGPKENFLIDIYFDESKMNVWKEKCIKSSDFITKKIKIKGESIINEKNKIRNEKNTNILQLKNDWNIIIGEYENLINVKEFSDVSTFSSIFEDYQSFIKNVNLLYSIINNIVSKDTTNNISVDNSVLEEVLENLKIIKNKQKYFQDNFQLLQNHNISIEEFYKKMKNLLIKSSVQINVVFTNYHMIKKSLLEIIEKIEKYSEGLNNLEKDFSYLSNPSYFPQAYQASIVEIKRRLIFNRKLMKDFERLKQLVIKENINRKQFIQDYGKFLTHDYVPQLKFSDLKLVIDFNNNDEIVNLPNILDDEDENIINNKNIYFDYEEFLIPSEENLKKDKIKSMNDGIIDNNVYDSSIVFCEVRKSGEEFLDKNNNYEEQIRNLKTKITELEIVNNIKESELKKIFLKLEQKDRKITSLQSDVEKFAINIENLSDNFLQQISYKDQKFNEKCEENENIIKILNSNNNSRFENCPMCKESITNSIDYQGWGNFVKDNHEKILEKNKTLSKLESRFQDLVNQTYFIKKTFFNHLHSLINLKNNEQMKINSSYENKLMSIEDILSKEKLRNDINERKNKELKNQIKNLNETLKFNETKFKDIYKIMSNIEDENKTLKSENEKINKLFEDSKTLVNNLNNDIKMRESKCEILLNDFKNIEKQYDVQKKNINQLSEEIITKVKEITKLKYDNESKCKMIENFENTIENSKINHIETLNKVHKANQITIEKLNQRIDDMTVDLHKKFQTVEDIKLSNRELYEIIEKKNEHINSLNEKITKFNHCNEDLKLKNEELFKKNEELFAVNELKQNENIINKKKIEEMNYDLAEKEKKINVINFNNFRISTN